MKSTKDINLYRLFKLLSRKRKNQIYFLFLLLIINGISESISMLTIIPFLTLITSGNDINNLPNLTKFLPININNNASAIIKYFGGKHPVNNYAWDTANSEKIIWIKDAIETWANAIKK